MPHPQPHTRCSPSTDEPTEKHTNNTLSANYKQSSNKNEFFHCMLPLQINKNYNNFQLVWWDRWHYKMVTNQILKSALQYIIFRLFITICCDRIEVHKEKSEMNKRLSSINTKTWTSSLLSVTMGLNA